MDVCYRPDILGVPQHNPVFVNGKPRVQHQLPVSQRVILETKQNTNHVYYRPVTSGVLQHNRVFVNGKPRVHHHRLQVISPRVIIITMDTDVCYRPVTSGVPQHNCVFVNGKHPVRLLIVLPLENQPPLSLLEQNYLYCCFLILMFEEVVSIKNSINK